MVWAIERYLYQMNERLDSSLSHKGFPTFLTVTSDITQCQATLLLCGKYFTTLLCTGLGQLIGLFINDTNRINNRLMELCKLGP